MAEVEITLFIYWKHFCFDKESHMNCMHKILVSKHTSVIKIKKVTNNFDKRLLQTIRIYTEKVTGLIKFIFFPKKEICYFKYVIFIKSESIPVKS